MCKDCLNSCTDSVEEILVGKRNDFGYQDTSEDVQHAMHLLHCHQLFLQS